MVLTPDRPAQLAALKFSAFGLDLEDHIGIDGAREGGSQTGRALLIRPVPPKPRPLPPTRPIFTQLDEEGHLELAIGAGPAGEFWFDAPGAGRFRLRGDGGLVEAICAAGPHAAARRQRVLLRRVLPAAALLNGLEVLHAAAVVLPTAAIAIHGPAGADQTSIALELTRRRARVLADDHLAVELTEEGVLAFPGIGTASVCRREADRMGESRLAAAGRVIAEDRRHVRLQLAAPERAPARLGALYVLRPHAGVRRVETKPVATPDPRLLLATMNSVCLTTPERLREHLEWCTRAARALRVCEVLVPEHAGPAETADAIAADAEAAL